MASDGDASAPTPLDWRAQPTVTDMLLANRRLRFRDFIGRQARVAAPLRTNGGDNFAIGTLVLIDHTYRGRFSLTAITRQPGDRPRCISRVHPSRIVPVEEPSEADQPAPSGT